MSRAKHLPQGERYQGLGLSRDYFIPDGKSSIIKDYADRGYLSNDIRLETSADYEEWLNGSDKAVMMAARKRDASLGLNPRAIMSSRGHIRPTREANMRQSRERDVADYDLEFVGPYMEAKKAKATSKAKASYKSSSREANLKKKMDCMNPKYKCKSFAGAPVLASSVEKQYAQYDDAKHAKHHDKQKMPYLVPAIGGVPSMTLGMKHKKNYRMPQNVYPYLL